MYRDPKRWSYLFQSYVLLTMLEAHDVPQVCWGAYTSLSPSLSPSLSLPLSLHLSLFLSLPPSLSSQPLKFFMPILYFLSFQFQFPPLPYPLPHSYPIPHPFIKNFFQSVDPKDGLYQGDGAVSVFCSILLHREPEEKVWRKMFSFSKGVSFYSFSLVLHFFFLTRFFSSASLHCSTI